VSAVYIGIDIGQKIDPTAIAVVEAVDRAADTWETRWLERLPLGTPYPEVARRLAQIAEDVREILATRPLRLPGRPFVSGRELAILDADRAMPSLTIFADATGVGQPIVDMLRVANVRCTPVYFTHGDRRVKNGDSISLGKGYLASRLKALLQDHRLSLPDTAEARQLATELLDYEIRVDENANDKYGAFKVGTHDDLVTALGLAVQVKPRSAGATFNWAGLSYAD